MILTLGLAFALFGSALSYEGLILGGYGATNFIQLVGTDHVCMGEDITPPIPQVLPAANPTWVAEYVDNTIYLCGGQVIHNIIDLFSRIYFERKGTLYQSFGVFFCFLEFGPTSRLLLIYTWSRC